MGATADGRAMAGDLEDRLHPGDDQRSGDDSLIQLAADSVSSEALADEYTGLYLDPVATTGDGSRARSLLCRPRHAGRVPDLPEGAADGVNPFVFIQGGLRRRGP